LWRGTKRKKLKYRRSKRSGEIERKKNTKGVKPRSNELNTREKEKKNRVKEKERKNRRTTLIYFRVCARVPLFVSLTAAQKEKRNY
jgi:hypothetical protein